MYLCSTEFFEIDLGFFSFNCVSKKNYTYAKEDSLKWNCLYDKNEFDIKWPIMVDME